MILGLLGLVVLGVHWAVVVVDHCRGVVGEAVLELIVRHGRTFGQGDVIRVGIYQLQGRRILLSILYQL
jgi:hypothetical protein